jgi:hypothetical protein
MTDPTAPIDPIPPSETTTQDMRDLLSQAKRLYAEPTLHDARTVVSFETADEARRFTAILSGIANTHSSLQRESARPKESRTT